MTTTDFSNLCIGNDVKVPTLSGEQKRYVNLDNAASTPPFKYVVKQMERFLPYYSSVHRGTGYKSQLSTHYYEEARKVVLEFLGANEQQHTCIFGKNTTEAINKLAHRFPFTPDKDIVLVSSLEHHSNDLPWRKVAKTVHIKLTPDGRLDERDFEEKLTLYGNKVALVAISGASNVTGFLPPIHQIAEKAHRAGAMFFVDAAQLAPHRKIDMLPLDHPAHIDFVALSAHKMYAPFGTGALVGRKDIFAQGSPDMVGGGTVEIVTLDDVVWTIPPEKDEAGSPNVLGAIALAASIRQLQEIGMDKIAKHEAILTRYTLAQLKKLPNVQIFGDTNEDETHNRLGVIPFNIKGVSHFLVAAILGHEYAIGVRNGCFCAHPYILHLLGLKEEQARKVRKNILANDRREVPGLVRISFGIYNTTEDIDRLTEALEDIHYGRYKGAYLQNPSSGEFHPQNWHPQYERYFTL